MRCTIFKTGLLSSLALLVACGSSSDRPNDRTPAPTSTAKTSEALTPSERVDASRAVLEALARIGKAEGLSPEVIATAHLENVQRYGKGAIVAQLGQRIQGIEVFHPTGGSPSMVLDPQLVPIKVTGSLVKNLHPKAEGTFALDDATAIAAAATTMIGRTVSVSAVAKRDMGNVDVGAYGWFSVALDASTNKLVHSARSKKVWFVGKRLQAAYYVELDVGAIDESTSTMEALLVSATDGSILLRASLSANDAFTYRVWAKDSGSMVPLAGPHGHSLFPHPTGTVDTTTVAVPIGTSLVKLESGDFSKKDPWLPPAATETLGNNITAYADVATPDGFGTGDIRPTTTAPLTFDRNYDVTKNPNATPDNSMATATQLFFLGNWLHDWFYDAGWDEASRNPQLSNLGRGGIANDRIRMEAQDYAGRNNADATTPADGGSPRIQMYLFNGQGSASLAITAPATIAGTIGTRTATFGPSNFDLTGSVVLVDDGAGTASDGCEDFLNAAAVKGKIALVDRGTCAFTQKVLNAEEAGAAGVLIVNNVAGGAPTLSGTAGVTIKIPVLSTTIDDGAKIKGALATGVTVRMKRDTALDRDGGLDMSIAAHEWGHVITNRLVGNGTGLINQQGGGMGEGWGDFIALLTLANGSNVAAQEAADWKGTYPVGGWVHGVSGYGSYYGIRRYPYSADLAKNPLTFKHISNGTKLPTVPDASFGDEGSSNAEVHATGEVWASMLWQCYVGLLRDKTRLTFDEATKRMRTYLVAGLKVTPKSPTILEARDAMLAAMYAADEKDFRVCSKAFADRGAGSGAVGPDRLSTTNVGVKESFLSGNDIVVIGSSLEVDVDCDGDKNFDNGEHAIVTIKIRNDGVDRLTATTAKLTSKTGVFVFDDGGKVSFPPSKPFETIEVKAGVTLKGATPVAREIIDIAIDEPTLLTPRTITTTLPVVVDYDDKAETAKIDNFDNPETPWKASSDTNFSSSVPWKRVKVGEGQIFKIMGDDEVSDYRLTSPPLVVSADKPLVMTWKHKFAFERSRRTMALFDGAVIELSEDDGMTWVDVGKPVYNGKLATADNDNPLKGREAFTYRNAKYPEHEAVRLDLGTAYAGKTVRIRFRVGGDEGTASEGMEIDDVAFDGIDNTPFPSRVADVATCAEPPPSDAGVPGEETGTVTNPAAGDGQAVGGGSCACRTVTGPGSASALGWLGGLAVTALVVSRRRRKN